MPSLQISEEPVCRIRIDPNLVDKFKRLRGGINEVGTKIVRDIGLRYEYDRLTGAFDILGPDPEILSLAIETLRFWVDEDLYPRSGITCQVGYPNKGSVFWRFHGDYARKFDHLFEYEIENLKQIPSLNIKAVPSKKNLEFVEIYCNFSTYHQVKDEIKRISSELAKIHEDHFFVPIADFHKARRFARSKGRDKSVLFALKEYVDSDKFRVWIFTRNYGDIIRARKEWVNHVGKIARDTSFEERRIRHDNQNEESSLDSAQFFGAETSRESDVSNHKHKLDSRSIRGSDLSLNKKKLNHRNMPRKNSQRDKLHRTVSGSNYDNMNFPRPDHMFFPVQREFYDVGTDENQESEQQNNNPWLDPTLLQNGQEIPREIHQPYHVAESKWITEPSYQLYQAKKPNRPHELNRIYMHHQVHRSDGENPKTELTLVKHPDSNLIRENIVSLRKSQIISTNTDDRFAPKRKNVQPLTAREIAANTKKTSQQLGAVRQPQSIHSLKQIKHREAQSNIRYHINVNGLDIFMYRQSVVKLNNVDALVNVVDPNLQEGGHIAKDVAVAAGQQVKDEIKVFMFNNGPLKVTETCVTSAGKLPCLGIINVATPKWENYFGVEEKCAIDLHTAIYNALKTAEKHKYRKIGLPTVGSESYFGIPKEIVAEVHVKALVDYSLAMGPLYPVLEIHLVDMDADMLYAIKQAYEDWASSPKFRDMAEKIKSAARNIPDPMKDISQRAESAVIMKDVPSHRSKNVVTFVEQSYTSEGHQMWTFDVLKKLKVYVYIGSVVKLSDVEAIVCGVDRKMKGTLAKLIRDSAGNKYELALNQARGQRSLVEGEVVVCSAGNLGVKWVFHSVVAQPLRKVSLKNLARLDSIYTQIFHAANKLDIKSLALPLIGAGRLREKFEIEQCSLQLVDNIIELCLNTGQELKLKEIHLVNISEINTRYLCQALRTRAHTKLRVENEASPPSRQEMFTQREQRHYSPNRHHKKVSKQKTQNNPESPKRLSPIQKRHGRIVYDKHALMEEQFKRRIKDMEEEGRAAMRKKQEQFAVERNASYNPRLVNGWMQNTEGVNGMVKYPPYAYRNGYVNASMPDGIIRHGNVTISIRRNGDISNDLDTTKSRAGSYHHSYNRQDQLTSHREKWDLVRQRSQSTDALPRRKESNDSEDIQAKDNRDPYYDRQERYSDNFQMYPDVLPSYQNNAYRYENQTRENRDRYYDDYERSPRRNYDTYETLVTEQEARDSDYKLYKNRDESRFRYHRDEPRKPVFDNRPEAEDNNKNKDETLRRSRAKDLNEEIDRILKERNTEDWPGTRIKEEVVESTFKEKEQVENRELQKLWAINDEFRKDLEGRHPDLQINKKETSKAAEEKNNIREKEQVVNNVQEEGKEVESERYRESMKDNKSSRSKNTEESKETKKSKFKFDNRVYMDSSKHKSKKKSSKKAKKNASKSSASTRKTWETQSILQDGGEPVQDGRDGLTATSASTSSPLKRYDSKIDTRYRQFDKYTNSDVYPVTPELTETREKIEGKQTVEDTRSQRTAKELSLSKNDDKGDFNWHSKSVSDSKSEDQSDRVKSLKSISSRPTVDSRTVQMYNKEGGGTKKTFSVLAGDVAMMEQYQNMSGKIGNFNPPSVKVA